MQHSSFSFPLGAAAGLSLPVVELARLPATPRAAGLPVSDDGMVVLERRTQRTRPPRMYQVVMLNDDYTPMEFVVAVLQEHFGKNRHEATQIMMRIHTDGRGVCGIYSQDVASTKVNLVMDAAQQAGHPLQCISEPVAR